VNKVLSFLNEAEDPWDANAEALKAERMRRLKQQKTIRFALNSNRLAAMLPGHMRSRRELITITIHRRWRDPKFRVAVDEEGSVTSLKKGGLAAQGGLQVGDRIVRIRGERITSGQPDVDRLLRASRSFELVLERTMQADEPSEPIEEERLIYGTTKAGAPIGFSLRVNTRKGVHSRPLVDTVARDSPFASQLRPGDEILEVNGAPLRGGSTKAMSAAHAMLRMTDGEICLRVRTRGTRLGANPARPPPTDRSGPLSGPLLAP